jgi:hypothetical protein
LNRSGVHTWSSSVNLIGSGAMVVVTAATSSVDVVNQELVDLSSFVGGNAARIFTFRYKEGCQVKRWRGEREKARERSQEGVRSGVVGCVRLGVGCLLLLALLARCLHRRRIAPDRDDVSWLAVHKSAPNLCIKKTMHVSFGGREE